MDSYMFQSIHNRPRLYFEIGIIMKKNNDFIICRTFKIKKKMYYENDLLLSVNTECIK